MKVSRLFFAASLVILLAGPVKAYPVPPVPLWSLVEQADTIAIAEVAELVETRRYEVESLEGIATGALDLWVLKDRIGFGNLADHLHAVFFRPRAELDYGSHIARLGVREILKGDQADYLEVPFHYTICPSPPDYRRGEKVVAFLGRDEESHRLYTLAYSYGTLYPRGDDQLGDLKYMVRSALALQQAGLGEEELASKKRSWLLEAAVRPGTRWHGLYELEPRNWPSSQRYLLATRWGLDGEKEEPEAKLSRAEQALLAEAFLSARDEDPTLPMLLASLAGFEDPSVDQAAMGWIEGLLTREDPPELAQTLIEAFLFYLGDADPSARMAARPGEHSWDLPPARLRQIWSQAKQDLGLPTVPARKL